MTALRLFPPALVALSLILSAMPSSAATYVLDDFSADTVEVRANNNNTIVPGFNLIEQRPPSETDGALSYTGNMSLTLSTGNPPPLGDPLRLGSIDNGTFSFSIADRTGAAAFPESIRLRYGSVVGGASFEIPSDAPVLRLDDVQLTGGTQYQLTVNLFGAAGLAMPMGSQAFTIQGNIPFLQVLLSNLTANIEDVRGLEVLITPTRDANQIIIGSIGGVLLTPEPGRAALTAMGVMTLLLRRRR